MAEVTASPPDDLAALLRQVDSAVRQSHIPRAIELARHGLRQGIQHPVLLHLRAHGLSDEGRYEEALRDL